LIREKDRNSDELLESDEEESEHSEFEETIATKNFNTSTVH
jgi:hypothetical protein